MKKIIIAVLIFIFFIGILSAPKTYLYPDKFEISSFEFWQQPDEITCGPTSMMMILRRYNNQTSFDNVVSRTKTKWFTYNGVPIGMTSPDYVANGLTQSGLKSKLQFGKEDSLKYLVSQNKPVIVLLRSGASLWHYVVVIGYDSEHFYIGDPSQGRKLALPKQDFLGSWSFKQDMWGYPTYKLCGYCKGTGKWMKFNFGPLSICEICGGSGQELDYLGVLLKQSDIVPNMMIVPVENLTK